jgi:amidohydrolase
VRSCLNDLSELKRLIAGEVDRLESRIWEMCSAIHANPELGMEEHKSSRLLCSKLEKFGFDVKLGIAGLPTSFVATFDTGAKGPHICYLAEYDALPELGHACGHNIIGSTAAFSGIVLSRIGEKLRGRITVLGTPDEEGSGGKIPLIEAGCFKDVDVAIMNHPWNFTAPWMPSVALGQLTVKFTGKGAHYSTPHRGTNALDCVLLTLNSLNTLRHGFRNDVIFGYTVDRGGVNPSVIPDEASVRIAVKSTDVSNLRAVLAIVYKCIKSIASTTGAKAEITSTPEYKESIPNLALIGAASRNFSQLKISFRSPELMSRSMVYISTDYGNVSHVVPSVSPTIAISSESVSPHTSEFAKAAANKKNSRAVTNITKVMAMTGIDVLLNDELLNNAKNEFSTYAASGFKNTPLSPIY